MKKVITAIAFLAFATSAPASTEYKTKPRFLVEMQIYDGGVAIASPRLIVDAGQTAKFVMQNVDSPKYDIEITANRASKSRVNFSSKIEINSPTLGSRKAEPSLTVGLDEMATVEFGNMALEQSVFRMEVRFKAIG